MQKEQATIYMLTEGMESHFVSWNRLPWKYQPMGRNDQSKLCNTNAFQSVLNGNRQEGQKKRDEIWKGK